MDASTDDILDDDILSDGLDQFTKQFDEAHQDFTDKMRKVNPYKPVTAGDGSGAIPVRAAQPVTRDENDAKLALSDTFFADKFATMRRKNMFDWDEEVLAKLNTTLYDDLRRQASIQMVIDDIGNSITSVGIETKFQASALLQDLMSLLRIRSLGEMITAVGLDDYRDDIVLRIIESSYGQSKRIEREQALRLQRDDQDKLDFQHTLASILRSLQDIAKDTRVQRTNSEPKPAKTLFELRRSFQGVNPKEGIDNGSVGV